jgi:hypothetical protein
MSVAMMNVRVMRMGVGHFLVPVLMRMRFAGRIVERVGMLVMFVMDVQMFVLHRFMVVQMLVPFGQM